MVMVNKAQNGEESKQLKLNGQKVNESKIHVQKKKIDVADWSVTIETWTFYPQDFYSFGFIGSDVEVTISIHWSRPLMQSENVQSKQDSVHGWEENDRVSLTDWKIFFGMMSIWGNDVYKMKMKENQIE